MPKPIQISIPTPCHENWDAMTPEAKGRFCSSCEKKVFDFTTLSDKEIVNILSKNENTCARITSAQLNRKLITPKDKSSLWMATSAAVISFMTIGNNMVSAQTQVNTEQTDLKTDNIISRGNTPKTIVRGTVHDLHGVPIQDANVIVKGSKKGVQTDYNGSFSIEVNQDEIIQFTFAGMIQQEVEIKNFEMLNVFLVEEIVISDDDIFVGVVAPLKQRTFFGRIFHSIGNLFR